MLRTLDQASMSYICPIHVLYICFQVKQLEMDKQVLEAHKAATHALKSCRETHGLTVEKVEDTLDALSEVSSWEKRACCVLPLAQLCPRSCD